MKSCLKTAPESLFREQHPEEKRLKELGSHWDKSQKNGHISGSTANRGAAFTPGLPRL
jgi:hypothetical protein